MTFSKPYQYSIIFFKYVYMAVYGLGTTLFGRMGKDEGNNFGLYSGIVLTVSVRFVVLLINIMDLKGVAFKILLACCFAFMLGVLFWALYIGNKRAKDFMKSYDEKNRTQKFWIVFGMFGATFLCVFSFVFA